MAAKEAALPRGVRTGKLAAFYSTMQGIDNVVTGKNNSGMATKRKPRKTLEKTNQFGKPLAKAIRTTVYAWKCSECGAITAMTGSSPPVRCSNRKGCGRIFYNEDA